MGRPMSKIDIAGTESSMLAVPADCPVQTLIIGILGMLVSTENPSTNHVSGLLIPAPALETVCDNHDFVASQKGRTPIDFDSDWFHIDFPV